MRYCPPPQALGMHTVLGSAGIVDRVRRVLMSGIHIGDVFGLLCWVVEERSGKAVVHKVVVHYIRQWTPWFPDRNGLAEAVFVASADRPFGLRGDPCLTRQEMFVVKSVAAGRP